MSNQTIFWLGLMSAAATVPIVQMVATAATAPEINKIAEAITVQILEPGSQGSGVILQRQGDVYTVLTAAHVVRNQNTAFKIVTPDGKKHQVISDSIRLPTVDIDLAVVKFRASTNYPIAKLGNCNVLTGGMDLYVAGYPLATKAITDTSVFVFREGKVSANSNKVLEKGYSLIYSNDTLPGMSGGAVLNQNGELVAIHGRGDREINSSGEAGAKTGFNLGIPINRFATIASSLGVNLGGKVAAIPQTTKPKAGDYLALGVQKSRKGDYRGALADYNQAIRLDPNFAIAHDYRGFLKENKLSDIQGALADYNQAIRLDPNFAIAYNNRGSLKERKLNNIQEGLADYNQSIQINPNSAIAYSNRGLLKHEKLNDIQGGLADYNQSIRLDPNLAVPYSNRGLLKQEKLNDIQGALADYNQSIRLDPNFAIAYSNRGGLKYQKLNDSQGALADYNQAIRLNPNFALAYCNRGSLKYNNLNDRSGGIADLQKSARLFKKQNNLAVYQQVIDQLKIWGVTDRDTGF